MQNPISGLAAPIIPTWVSWLFGVYASYYADVASGASIVLLQAAVFIIVLTVTVLQKYAAHRLLHTHTA